MVQRLELIWNQDHIELIWDSRSIPLDLQSTIHGTYSKEGWGPVVDYTILVSIVSDNQSPISFIQIHSADEPLEDSWNYIQESLQKIASYVECTLILHRF